MHILFVDESGDPGLNNSPTRQYVLAGLLMPLSAWWGCRQRLLDHRERIQQSYGAKIEAELHASEYLGQPESILGWHPGNAFGLYHGYFAILGVNAMW